VSVVLLLFVIIVFLLLVALSQAVSWLLVVRPMLGLVLLPVPHKLVSVLRNTVAGSFFAEKVLGTKFEVLLEFYERRIITVASYPMQHPPTFCTSANTALFVTFWCGFVIYGRAGHIARERLRIVIQCDLLVSYGWRVST